MRRAASWATIALLLAGGLGSLAWQRHINTEMQRELEYRHAQRAEQARLEAEHRRLQASQISAEELARRTEERATLTALATEIELARRRTSASSSPSSNEAAPPPAPRLSLREYTLDASEWKNAGDREPIAAIETALWAAAHGDIATLAEMLVISETSRTRATGLIAALPAAMRGEVATPEQLVAVLTANAVPLGSASVAAQFDYPPGARLVLQMTDPDGKSREAAISLQRYEGRWRLVVPDAALRGYLEALQNPPGS